MLKIETAELSTLEVGPEQVLVRIHAFGINPVETYIRNGMYDPLPALPYTPGVDGAGVIVSIGSNVTTFLVDDRVWLTGSVTGTYAQYCICDSTDVHILPRNLSFDQGAGIGIPYRTAYRALVKKANAREGESVLVHGASGGVGIAAIQIAKMLGLSPIIGTTSSTDDSVKRMLYECGATMVASHGDLSGVKVDIIIENLANANLGQDLKLLNKYGRVIVVGNRGEVVINPRDLMKCEGSIIGMVGPGSISERLEIDAALQKGLEAGALSPVVGLSMPLADIQEAHEEIITHARGTRGKIVVNPFQYMHDFFSYDTQNRFNFTLSHRSKEADPCVI